MVRVYKRGFMVLILLVVIVVFWSEVDIVKLNGDKTFDKPLMTLSILPDEISRSIEILNKRAGNFKKGLTVRKGFTINSLKLSSENYISSKTPLILETYYHKSNILEQNIIAMPENFVGLTVGELKTITEKWKVKEYSPGKVMTLYRSLDKLSPKDRDKMHLGVRNGRVAIFYGESGEQNLKKITDIKIEELPLQEKKNLQNGIIINSDEELLSVLDSLISSINMD